MTRLMAWDMCHPRQRWRVSVDRDSPRRHEEKQHSDMRNRIRARQAGDAKCVRVAPRHFPRAIKTRKDRSPREKEREKEREGRERRGREKRIERKSGGHILLAQVTSRVRATRSNGTFEFGRLLLRNARGENSGERQRLESRLNVSHARDIE